MTSMSFMRGAGLKKCMPTNRSGCSSSFDRAVIDIEEVFVAKITSGETIDSKFLKRSFLIDSFSTIASITRSHDARSLNEFTISSLENISDDSLLVSFFLPTKKSRFF